ncbi:MAG: peptidoglycan synthetase, partial [Flammeovirgaceae bacterium]|nr:peptidoglycan synthetase [Flammeovirgaceae bacterium]
KGVQIPVVYFNPEKVSAKNLAPITEADVKSAFGNSSIKIFNNAQQMQEFLKQQTWKDKNLLFMSSGNFGGIDVKLLADKIIG